MTVALEGGEWSAARPGHTLLPGKTRYPFYRRLGGPQGWSGWAENLIPTGIQSWTVQPVVSLYTDRATWPTVCVIIIIYCYSMFQMSDLAGLLSVINVMIQGFPLVAVTQVINSSFGVRGSRCTSHYLLVEPTQMHWNTVHFFTI